MPGADKSGALLIRDAPPHYLLWGDQSVHLATSDDLVTFRTVNNSLLRTRAGGFDGVLVEAGPPPLRLRDGNYLFIFNSAGDTRDKAAPRTSPAAYDA